MATVRTRKIIDSDHVHLHDAGEGYTWVLCSRKKSLNTGQPMPSKAIFKPHSTSLEGVQGAWAETDSMLCGPWKWSMAVGAWAMHSPVRSRGEEQETLLLLKSEMLYDVPEHFDGGVIFMVAAIVSGCLLQVCEVVMGETTYKELQLFIPEKRQCWTSAHLPQAKQCQALQ